MIARTWRGCTDAEDAASYHEYLMETGVRNCRNTPGNMGVYVLRRPVEAGVEFLFISLWDSMEAVQRFAGSDSEQGVFYPEDEAYLIEYDRHVKHFDVLEGP